jgi:F-type H+/Na+-transporting ATPase subunit alpha
LNRGRRLVEVLKQPQYQPLGVEQQVIVIYAANGGFLDAVPVERVRDYEAELLRYLDTRHAGLLASLAETRELTDEIKSELNAALKEFGERFAATAAAA